MTTTLRRAPRRGIFVAPQGLCPITIEVFVPVLLIAFATLSAGLMAYGTHPDWAQYDVGLPLIMLTRRLQWPLAAVSLIFSLVTCATVISGARRAWWLIGLAPVLALFVHRFATSPLNRFAINDDPQFVAVADSKFVHDEDWVVALEFEEQPYAYPMAALWTEPVVVQTHHDRRMMLMWSAGANRAVAVNVDRTLHARELDVVSTPGDALLLYNARLGQFVNGLTGRTVDGGLPDAFHGAIATTKSTWKQWRTANPQGKVLARRTGGRVPHGPVLPMAPRDPFQRLESPFEALVAIVTPGPEPAAIKPESITAAPANLVAGGVPIFVFRDEKGVARAFDRRVEIDLCPRFKLNTDKRRPRAAFVDVDTDTGWSAAGVAVDGERKGQRLAPVAVEEDVYFGVMKRWYPDLVLHDGSPKSPAPTTRPADRM